MRKQNYPVQQQPDISKQEMSEQVGSISALMKLPPIDSKDINALEKRIEDFFTFCQTKSLRPSVTLLAVALGVRRETLWKWEQSNTPRGEAISRAKGIIEALTEQWLSSGKISPPSGIFILKNHFNWRDTVDINAQATRVEPMEDIVPSLDDIKKLLPTPDSEIFGGLDDSNSE